MSDGEPILAALDPEQRVVASTLDGPVAVIAGAGTGKTRAITHRIAYGAAVGAIDPASTLAVTFTTRAAGEMRARLRALGVPRVQARTFHSAALRMLQFFWPHSLGLEVPPLLEGRYGVLAEAASRVGLKPDTALIRDLGTEVSWAKVSNVAPGEYPALARATGRQVSGVDLALVARVLTGYEEVKNTRGRIDFDDILLLTLALMTEHPSVAAQIRSRYRHFVVDEFQDLSPVQNTLLESWLGGRGDVCVVGDPNQSIHSFAGADPGYLTGFAARHPGTTVVRLVRDYRSTPQVVDLANRLIGSGRRAGVQLQAQLPAGPAVEFAPAEDEASEAAAVAQWLVDQARAGTPWRELAVLYRINAMSPTLEAALTELRVPYLIRGSERFYDRPEIRQALGQLRVQSEADAEAPALGAVKDILGALGWSPDAPTGAGQQRERWESLSALVDLAGDLSAHDPSLTLAAVVEEFTRRAADQQVPVAAGVTLATLHSAKGLEWDGVALFGIHEGTVPFVLARTPQQVAEERRLLYVGITRARRSLRVSWSSGRTGRGRREPSRFLTGLLPAAMVEAGAPPLARRSRHQTRTLQSATCRVCGLSVDDAAGRKLGRHQDCPSDFDEVLLDTLKSWRLDVARQASLPAFVIFTDATLQAIVEAEPTSAKALLAISGVGNAKLERYGSQVLDLVREHRTRQRV